MIQGGSDTSDGVYRIRASFWSHTEQANIPYVVKITISQDGYYYATVEATIQPS